MVLRPVSCPAKIHCTTVFAVRNGKISRMGVGWLISHTPLSFVPGKVWYGIAWYGKQSHDIVRLAGQDIVRQCWHYWGLKGIPPPSSLQDQYPISSKFRMKSVGLETSKKILFFFISYHCSLASFLLVFYCKQLH